MYTQEVLCFNRKLEEGSVKIPAGKSVGSKPEPRLPILISHDDVPYQLAYDAHRMSSFDPEKRAQEEQEEYVRHMQNVYEGLAPLATTPEKRALLAEELARYKQGYLKHLSALLSASSRTASAMIVGPAKFPSGRNQKALAVADKRMRELLDWRKKAQAGMRKRIAPEESKVISSDDPNAVELLQAKIVKDEEQHDMMRRANLIIKNKKLSDEEKVAKLLADFGMKENTARKLLEPGVLGNIGFPAYALRNSSANIRRMKLRLDELQAKRAQESREVPFEGGRIVDSVEDNRVRVFFDEKPDAVLRGELKKRGFRWAPSIEAWQRHRSPEAMRKAREVVSSAHG